MKALTTGASMRPKDVNDPSKGFYSSVSLVKLRLDPAVGFVGYEAETIQCDEPAARKVQAALQRGLAVFDVDIDARSWGGNKPGSMKMVMGVEFLGYLGREFVLNASKIEPKVAPGVAASRVEAAA